MKYSRLETWRPGRLLAIAVDVHQVHIRAVVQLVAAEFAQGKDCERRIHQPAQRVQMLRRPMTALQLAVRLAQRRLDQHIGQGRDLRRGFRQGRDLQHVAQHDADILAPLEPRQRHGNIAFGGTGAETRQAFVKFFLGKTAVKIPLPQKGRQQIRILDQRVPQKPAVAKDHDGVVRQKIMLIEQPHHFGRLDQPLEQEQGAIRIRSFGKQPRQRRSQPRRDAVP